jgi:hypothetical protein
MSCLEIRFRRSFSRTSRWQWTKTAGRVAVVFLLGLSRQERAGGNLMDRLFSPAPDEIRDRLDARETLPLTA